jgi:hypothetical protein
MNQSFIHILLENTVCLNGILESLDLNGADFLAVNLVVNLAPRSMRKVYLSELAGMLKGRGKFYKINGVSVCNLNH